jgi:ubiquinone/menaquinone biosynthesis C-methylase UbiE
MDVELIDILKLEALHTVHLKDAAPLFQAGYLLDKENSSTAELFCAEFAQIPSNIDVNLKEKADFEVFISKTGFSDRLMELDGKIVLDAGCGSGRFAAFAAPRAQTFVAVDIGRHIHLCANSLRYLSNSVCVQADLLNLPLQDNSIDLIYSIGVIHHTGNMPLALSELYRVLKPGGALHVWVYSPAYYGNIFQKTVFRWVHQCLRSRSPQFNLWVTEKILFPIGRFQMLLARRKWTKALFAPLYALRIPRHEDPNEMKSTIMDYFMPPHIEITTDRQFEKMIQDAGFCYSKGKIPTSALAVKPLIQ